MSVSNGQLANATTFNNAFMSRTADDNTTGKKDLQNADAASGANVTNVQREINSLNSFSGRTSGSVFDVLPSWANNDIGTVNDDLFMRSDALTAEFNPTSGHTHSGAGGEGPQIAANTLTGLNYYRADWQEFAVVGAAGLDDDVSASFVGFTPGGTSGAAGVITTAPNNKVYLVKTSDGTNVEDAEGQRVYGRITESGGVWTLTYYTNEAGVETAYSMTSTDITVYFRQVFTLGTLPTIGSDVGAIGSLDYTADIVDASATQRGAMSTGTQTLAGAKTWTGLGTFSAGGLFTGNLRAEALLSVDDETDSTATGANADVGPYTKTLVRFTDAGLLSIRNIENTVGQQLLLLSNQTTVDIDIVNDSGGTAAERIITGTGANLTLTANASLLLCYDTVISRWIVIGGSGSGSGGGQFTTQDFSSTTLTTTADGFQRWRWTGGVATLASIDSTLIPDGGVITIHLEITVS